MFENGVSQRVLSGVVFVGLVEIVGPCCTGPGFDGKCLLSFGLLRRTRSSGKTLSLSPHRPLAMSVHIKSVIISTSLHLLRILSVYSLGYELGDRCFLRPPIFSSFFFFHHRYPRGCLLQPWRPPRLDIESDDHARACAFPPPAPPMVSFLSVGVRSVTVENAET